MSNSKITDLRREVKERLTVKGIVDLSEFKLKPINIGHDEDKKKVRSALESNLTKIGNSLTTKIISSEISEDDKITKIQELLVGDIRVDISNTNDSNLIRLKKSFKKGIHEDDTYLNITIKEGDTEV